MSEQRPYRDHGLGTDLARAGYRSARMTAVVMESYQALLMGVMRVGTLRLLGRGETRTGGNSRPAGPEQRKQASPVFQGIR
jgi:hypothetical protein